MTKCPSFSEWHYSYWPDSHSIFNKIEALLELKEGANDYWKQGYLVIK